MAAIYEIFGTEAHKMTLALMEAARVAERIPAGAPVALKPNLVLAGSPEDGATTHPGVVSGCIEYLRANGVTDISVIESAWVGAKTEDAAAKSGCAQVCQRYGVPFFDLKRDKTRVVETPLRPMEICCRALDAGFLIDLPVLKGHCQTAMTCALKNCKGCIPDREKRRFHTEGLMEPIAALAAVLRPALTIVDSICGDLNFEEGGNPVQTNHMFLGWDPVQTDAYGCQLLGLSPEDVPYIGLAERWGAGSARVEPSDIARLNEPREGAGYPAAAGLVKELTRNVRQDSACSACYAALVRGLYLLREEGVNISGEIAIGQGWRGKEFPGPGIGTCCAMAGGYVPGCPPKAKAVADFLRKC